MLCLFFFSCQDHLYTLLLLSVTDCALQHWHIVQNWVICHIFWFCHRRQCCFYALIPITKHKTVWSPFSWSKLRSLVCLVVAHPRTTKHTREQTFFTILSSLKSTFDFWEMLSFFNFWHELCHRQQSPDLYYYKILTFVFEFFKRFHYHDIYVFIYAHFCTF